VGDTIVRQKEKYTMSNPPRVAILWFPSEAEYSEYQKACAKFDTMIPFPRWKQRVEALVQQGEAGRGPKIVKVYAGVDSFLGYCRTRKINPDSKAKGWFAAELHKKDDGMKN
jgi:hypothetical protein